MQFSAFSEPGGGDFVSLAEALAGRAFTKTLQAVNRLVQQMGNRPLNIGPDKMLVEGPATLFWRPELGAVRLASRGGLNRDDWPWICAQMQLAGMVSSLLPSVNVEVEATRPLFVAGHVVQGSRFRVRGDQTALEISDGKEVLLRLVRVAQPGLPPVWARDPDADIVRLGSASAAVLCDGSWEAYWYPGSEPVRLHGDRAESRRTLEAALVLLERHLPLTYLWVTLLLHELAVSEAPNSHGTTSGSSLSWPGHVRLSQASLLQTIIMLVHECSHQYFHLVLWNLPVVKKGAPPVYSVLKETKRPLDKVLLGYHAFANVVLTLTQLRRLDTGIEQQEIEHQIYSVGRLVAELDDVLLAHQEHITDAGLAVYQPLRQRLTTAVKLPAAGRRAS